MKYLEKTDNKKIQERTKHFATKDELAEKTNNLATQDQFNVLAKDIIMIVSESQVTKDRLEFLEEDIAQIIEKQKETKEKISKLDSLHKSIEILSNKVNSKPFNSKNKIQTKVKMEIIQTKIKNLQSNEDIEIVNAIVKKTAAAKNIRMGDLIDLVNKIIELEKKDTVRLSKFQELQSLVSKLTIKVNNIHVTSENKEETDEIIKSIKIEIKVFPSKNQIEELTTLLNSFISDNRFTIG